MFLLTSLDRVKASLGITSSDQDGILLGFITAASGRIAKLLRRVDSIETKARTEYFSPFTAQRVFRPPAYPIVSVTDIYIDSTGHYTGGETLIPAASYFISADARTIVFALNAALVQNATFPAPGGVYPKSLRIRYTAGMAPHAVRSSWVTTTDSGGTMTVGKFIQGQDSAAVGRIVARGATSITYECLRGVFQTETIAEYSNFNAALQGGGVSAETQVTASLVSVTSSAGISQLSLSESAGDLVQACEMQIRYLRDGRDGFENKEEGNDGKKRFTGYETIGRQPRPLEITDLLETHRNKVPL